MIDRREGGWWMDRNRWTDGWVDELGGWKRNGWTHGQVDGWMDRKVDG